MLRIPFALVLFLSLPASVPVPRAAAATPRLRDAVLRCCVLHADPFLYSASHPPYNYAGLNIDIFIRLMDYTGFRCEQTDGGPMFRRFASNSSVAWSDYLRMTAACAQSDGTLARNSSCPCDISPGTWFEDPSRQIVQFLPRTVVSDFRIITHVNNTVSTTSPWLFVDGFEPVFWVVLPLLAACFAVVKVLDPYYAPDRTTPPPVQSYDVAGPKKGVVDVQNQRPSLMRRVQRSLLKSRGLYQARKALFSTMMAMIGRPRDRENKSRRRWLLNYTICLLGLILTLVYESAMTAKLVQETLVSEYGEVSDLVNCKIPDSDICIPDGDIIKELWGSLMSNRPCAANRADRSNWSGPRYVTNYDELFAAVSTGKCKYALTEGRKILSMQHGRYCGSLVSVGEPFGTQASAMIAPHGWVYFDEMREATLRVLESNIVAAALETSLAEQAHCELSPKPQLTFSKLRLFFIITFIACGGMAVFMVLDQDPGRG